MSSFPDALSNSLPGSMPEPNGASLNEHDTAMRSIIDGDSKWDQRLIAWSQWLNPILVKETRQALKSRQFMWTFVLLTIVLLAWSYLAVISMVPNIYYASNGTSLLVGYVFILMVPATIIIPQATFRSMASELEDGTFETISLSLLSPRQIILGKLSVAGLQLMIYLSMVAPCIALTYLLRGVTLETIFVLMVSVVLASLSISIIAVLTATLAQSRAMQVVFSIVLIGAQIGLFIMMSSIVIGIVQTGEFGWQGWMATGIVTICVGLYSWLFARCAACQIGMQSENRSTPIRVPLFIIGVSIAILYLFTVILNGSELGTEYSIVLSVLANLLAIHWAIAGALIMGESGIISARARRSLPNSLLGRLFLTWFNPGAGPGYIFVLLSFIGPCVVICLLPICLSPIVFQQSTFEANGNLTIYCSALAAYLAFYLGLTRLVAIMTFSRMRSGRIVATFAFTIFLVVIAMIATCSLSLAQDQYKDMDYHWYCFANPFWTLAEIFPDYNNGNYKIGSGEVFTSFVCLITSAIAVFLINAFLTARDVTVLHIETPQRVIAERSASRRISDDDSEFNMEPGEETNSSRDPF